LTRWRAWPGIDPLPGLAGLGAERARRRGPGSHQRGALLPDTDITGQLSCGGATITSTDTYRNATGTGTGTGTDRVKVGGQVCSGTTG
jgi:hypothetical protein